MAELKYKPVRHDHAAFLEKARQAPGFSEVYESLESEYALVNANLKQDTMGERMDRTKNAK
jgi:hypothetical protein